MRYTVTNIGTQGQWIITSQGQFVQESTSLANALAYLAGVLQYGDTILYTDEPVQTP